MNNTSYKKIQKNQNKILKTKNPKKLHSNVKNTQKIQKNKNKILKTKNPKKLHSNVKNTQKIQKNQKKILKTKNPKKLHSNVKKTQKTKKNTIKTKTKKKLTHNNKNKTKKNIQKPQKHQKNTKITTKHQKKIQKIKNTTKKKYHYKKSKINKNLQKTHKKIYKITKKTINKNAHCKNGNINQKKLTILSWNKGNSKIINKIDAIRHLAAKNTPSIIAIQEMNLTAEIDLEDIQIPNYTLEIDNLLKLRGRTRAATYISDQLKYVRRYDLETDGEAVVWLTLHPKGTKPINFQNFYRQWQFMGPEHAIPNTNSIKSQQNSLKKVVQKWLIAAGERETISASDTNINLNKDYKNLLSMRPFDRALYPLYKILKQEIINSGIIPIKTLPTKTNIHKDDSWIDHLFTNRPLQITNHLLIPTGLSDHKILIFERKSKTPITHPKFNLSRNYSLVDWSLMEQQLNNDPRLNSAATDDNTNRITENIINAINDALDNQVKIKKIQIKIKNTEFCSEQTLQLIQDK